MANRDVFTRSGAFQREDLAWDGDSDIELRALNGGVMIAFVAKDESLCWEQWMTIDEAETVLAALRNVIADARSQSHG